MLGALVCYLLLLTISGTDSAVHIALTTIPPRFNTISHSLKYWFEQDVLPTKIYIFVPATYKRFRKKIATDTSRTSNAEVLEAILMHDIVLSQHVRNGHIMITPIQRDWGPITRLMGALQLTIESTANLTSLSKTNCCNSWLFADDDVRYRRDTVSQYLLPMKEWADACENDRSIPYIGLTRFARDHRMWYQLPHETERRNIHHVQGVDTYILPSLFLDLLARQNYSENGESVNVFVAMVDYIHRSCPSSFYQDDYVIAFLLNLHNVDVYSIAIDGNVASHIDGVSKSNFQMHTHAEVFAREDSTKLCLQRISADIYSVLHSAN